MDRRVSEMQAKRHGFMNRNWQIFERQIRQDGVLRDRVYNSILADIRSRGYNARIVNYGGSTVIEITD